MSYISKKGRRPIEKASKAAHTYLINDEEVQKFLKLCNLPKSSSEIDISDRKKIFIKETIQNPIKRIIAVDGGYTEIIVKKEFPSSNLGFFQIGATFFDISDLDELKVMPFIDEEDMEKLREIERLKLVIPVKGISIKGENSLNESIRKSIYNFFYRNPDNQNLFIETLKWFIFREYDTKNIENYKTYQLASCPNLNCNATKIILNKDKMNSEYKFTCDVCGNTIYLTDVFRLHEVIDEELGAKGILGYLCSLIEQMFIIHIIRLMLKTKPMLIEETLFIKDGPLAFFGQTANMHKYMRQLINYLSINDTNVYLVGLEKTGAFVEHADEIKDKLQPGEIFFLSNDYIYKYILPGTPDPENPYARTSYYSGKLFFKDRNERIYVVTLPTKDPYVINNPKKSDFRNIDIILKNLQKLKCDMYDDSLVPIALVNKLVSLANHPSSIIIEKFSKTTISN